VPQPVPSAAPRAVVLALLATALLAVAGAGPARAWKLYNDSLTKDFNYEVYDEGLKLIEEGTVGRDSSVGCSWSKNKCNPDGGRGSELTVVFKSGGSTQWACTVTMLSGGFALVYEVDNGNLPDVYWCFSQINENADSNDVDANGDGVKNVDKYVTIDWSDDYLSSKGIKSGSVDYKAADRHVRFLVTGDPQIDFRGLNTCGNRDRCELQFNPDAPDNYYDASTAYGTFLNMTDLLRANQYSYKRWNSDVRGIIVSGDLTATARWSETKFYMQMSTADNIFKDGDVSTPKRHPWDQHIPLMEKLYEGLGNHDHVDETHDDHKDRKLCDAGPSFNEARNNCEGWIANYVADHKRGAQRTTRPTVGDIKDIETFEPHYSWEWHDVHFVQLNVLPVDDVVPNRPHVLGLGALSFLKEDLANAVGDSGRPVVLIHHYGFDAFSTGSEQWWTDTELVEYWNAIAKYNVIAIFTGHQHLAVDDLLSCTPWSNPSCSSWRADFEAPTGALARDDGATSIPAFVAGATLYGTYLDVTIDDCNTLTVTRGSESDSVSFSAPTERSLACDPTAECVPVTVSADDSCEGRNASIAGAASSGICEQSAPEPYVLGSTLVTLTCENSDGSLVSDCSEEVTVVDTWGPSIDCPEVGGTPIECGDPLVWEADIQDNCDDDSLLTVSCSPVPGGVATLGADGRRGRCEASDTVGNTSRCVTPDVFVVEDTLVPEVVLKGAELEVTECGVEYVDPGAGARDQCDGVLAVTRAPAIIDTSRVGDLVLTYAAADASGNVGKAFRGLMVADSTPPVVKLFGAALVEEECTLGAVWSDPGAQAKDQCWGDLEVSTTGGVDLGQVGAQNVTYGAADGSGHRSTVDRTVVVRDTTPPAIVLDGAAELTLECGIDPYVERGARSSDLCSGQLQVQQQGAVDPSTVGDYRILYGARDDVGRTSTIDRLVHVEDTTAPAIVCDADIVVEPIGPEGAVVHFGASASDACDGAPTIVCPRSGDTFAPGSTTKVACSAGDDAANVSRCTLSVQVLSEAEVVAVLDESLTELAESGTINDGQTWSIDQKLVKILAAIEAGDDAEACDKLAELELQLEEFVREGTLTADEAEAIESTTANLASTLACTGPPAVQ
jgi:hypothetical protein